MEYLHLAQMLGIRGTLHGNEFRAHCPIHDDSTPSFSMNIKLGLWKCHAKCGGGEFLGLVQQILGCTYTESIEWVNNNGNPVSLDNMLPDLENKLFYIDSEITPSTQEYWKQYFLALPQDKMPIWFLDRGFTWGTINHWDIRYDMMWNAVVIPISVNKEMVGTVTRNTFKEPKYENSPGLPKSEILWGEISRIKKDIIICEGVLDNLWLWQLGYNSVGLLGTDISQLQIEILQELGFGEIILALDNDEAGNTGTQKAIISLLKNGWLLPQVTRIKFPDGVKDPQDCSKELFKQLYEQRRPAIDFVFA